MAYNHIEIILSVYRFINRGISLDIDLFVKINVPLYNRIFTFLIRTWQERRSAVWMSWVPGTKTLD